MAASSPPHRVVTPDDQSALILIIVLFLMVTFTLSVFGRVAVRYGMTRSVTEDDWGAIAATVFGLAQSVAVAIGTKSGLGKAERLLSSSQVSDVVKALYTSDYFYLAAIGCSKVSVLFLLRRLAASKIHKQIGLWTTYYVAVWTVASILTVGVRCGATAPWNFPANHTCVNVRTVWYAIAPFDILSELVIMILPIVMMAPVHVPLRKKVFVVVAFASRILFVAATIARLFYLPLNFTAKDFTLGSTNPTFVTQTVLCLAITTASIPAMKPLMEAFNSGGLIVRVAGASSGHYGTGSNSRSQNNFKMASVMSNRIHPWTNTDNDDNEINSESSGPGKGRMEPLHENTVNQYVTRKLSHGSDGDRDSISSQARSEQMIIRKNVQWTVKYEGGQGVSTT